MRITHVALGDPEGPAHTGYEADCGPCRVRLLEAFRAPADVPEQDARKAVEARHPSGGGPHLIVPGSGRTVDLYPEPPGDRDDPFTEADENPDISVHTTEHGIINSDEGPGGLWWARCSCGWEANGNFARDNGRPVAAHLAKLKAEKHRENPK
jgi:hypothetical protein